MTIIRNLALRDRISFKKHCLLRMHERNICADDVRDILINGRIIENYPDVQPLPCCLISGYTDEQRPVHVVVAKDTEDSMLWIITVYQPNPEEWNEHFTERKQT